MYDVIVIDARGDEVPLAEHLADRDEAVAIARRVAAEREVGRMILTGPQKPPSCVCVVPLPVAA